MTDKPIDLDGFRKAYAEYEAHCKNAGVPVTLQAERMAFKAGWDFHVISQRAELKAKDERIALADKILAAASDLSLSLTNKEFAKLEPVMECHRALRNHMNEYESRYLDADEDCRKRV